MMNIEEIIKRRLTKLNDERADILSERKSADYCMNECIKNAKMYAEEKLDYDARLVILQKEIDFMTELLNKEKGEDSAE